MLRFASLVGCAAAYIALGVNDAPAGYLIAVGVGFVLILWSE